MRPRTQAWRTLMLWPPCLSAARSAFEPTHTIIRRAAFQAYDLDPAAGRDTHRAGMGALTGEPVGGGREGLSRGDPPKPKPDRGLHGLFGRGPAAVRQAGRDLASPARSAAQRSPIARPAARDRFGARSSRATTPGPSKRSNASARLHPDFPVCRYPPRTGAHVCRPGAGGDRRAQGAGRPASRSVQADRRIVHPGSPSRTSRPAGARTQRR